MIVSEKSYSRLLWTAQEENMLKKLKEESNISSWKLIAKIINENFPKISRTGKQCRERYINYVRFDQDRPKMTKWSREEDLLLFNKFVEEGPKWVKIATFLQKKYKNMLVRSQNCLKNRFYGIIRKIIRKIQRFYRQKNRKVRKIIRPQIFAKILQSKLDLKQIGDPKIHDKQIFLEKLKKNLIEFALRCQEDIEQSPESTEQFIGQVQKFYDLFKSNSKGRSIKKKMIQKQSSESERTEKYIQDGVRSNSLSFHSQIMNRNSQMESMSNLQAPVSKQKIIQNIILKQPEGEQVCQQQPLNYNYFIFPYFFMAPNQQLCPI